jgi:hypothetical protein
MRKMVKDLVPGDMVGMYPTLATTVNTYPKPVEDGSHVYTWEEISASGAKYIRHEGSGDTVDVVVPTKEVRARELEKGDVIIIRDARTGDRGLTITNVYRAPVSKDNKGNVIRGAGYHVDYVDEFDKRNWFFLAPESIVQIADWH